MYSSGEENKPGRQRRGRRSKHVDLQDFYQMAGSLPKPHRDTEMAELAWQEHADAVVHSDRVTLTRYLIRAQRSSKSLQGKNTVLPVC
jgi:hypothetical protein